METTLKIAGVDEVGRGPLVGPVTAACVIFGSAEVNPAITDSKKLSEAKREALYEEIISEALVYAVSSVGPREIERINIREAARLAMRQSAEEVACKLAELSKSHACSYEPHFLVDGNTPFGTNLSQETIIKGDAKVQVIGAASIVAKVVRDRFMKELDTKYPGYGFSAHKGYPTKFHLERLRELGPTPEHRRTFRGVRELIETAPDYPRATAY